MLCSLRDLEQREFRRARIHSAGGIVRIDDDDRARARRDQASQMIEIRLPVLRRIGAVVHRLRADFASTAVYSG